MAEERSAERYGADDARAWIAVPQPGADKYSRGVLGVQTGSDRFPGAAVLGVEGAIRTGVGMVRYIGPSRATDFVLRRRPEAVTADGRVQAWLVGSGMPPERDDDLDRDVRERLGRGVPAVLDAGALDLIEAVDAPVVITPHFGELVPVLQAGGLEVSKDEVAADPARWAVRGAEVSGATVLLKGVTTYVADGGGLRHAVPAGPPWVATAGAGDVLGGVLGALLATHSQAVLDDPARLADVAAAAAWVHGEAGRTASAGGPIAALDIADALPAAVRGLLAGA